MKFDQLPSRNYQVHWYHSCSKYLCRKSAWSIYFAMSFSNLKSARKTKERHSFVKHSADAEQNSEHRSLPSNSNPVYVTSTSSSAIHTTSSPGSSNILQDSVEEPFVSTAGNSRAVDALSAHAKQDSSTPVINASFLPTTAHTLAITGAEKRKTKPVSLGSCHSVLPPTVEIREFTQHGRGIYTKTSFTAGTCLDRKRHRGG